MSERLQMQSDDLAGIAGLTNLRTLMVTDSSLSDDKALAFANLTRLEELAIMMQV